MASGYHVTVAPVGAPKDDATAREWVETNPAKVVSEQVRDYLNKRLPDSHKAEVSAHYEERNPKWRPFDDTKLREPANVPQEETP